MDNQFNDLRETDEQKTEQIYVDPNASYNQPNNKEYDYYQPNTNNTFGQDNFNYNVGNNTGYNSNYNSEMDTSPLSMGDWVLTILTLMIPCAGVIIYLVWAFGKNGNINRRNYCRAYLAIYAVVMVIYLIIMLVFGAAIVGSM